MAVLVDCWPVVDPVVTAVLVPLLNPMLIASGESTLEWRLCKVEGNGLDQQTIWDGWKV